MDNTKKWKSTNWWTSKYNFSEEFRNSMDLPEKVIIHDSTLRDGEQTAGVVFSIDDKIEIAKMLDELGVERIEAGMPAVSKQDYEAIKKIVNLKLNAKIFSFARATKKDIDMAKELGADGVIIEIPVGRPKLKYQFSKWTDEDVIEKSVETVKYSKKLGLETVYFGYDTTRADFEFLEKLYDKVIFEGKPDSIGIVDTMGSILPGAAKELIKKIKSKYDIKVEYHTHNEFSIGVASSFAAVEAGAEVIHTCLNGLGERTGNVALEQIIVGLKVLYGIDNDYKFEKINSISKRVAEMANFPIPVNKPIIGENIFVRESGIGIEYVLNQPLAMFALNPSFIGQKAGVVLGKKSGVKSIDVKCNELKINVDESMKSKILEKVKNESISKKRLISDEEFIDIVKSLS